MFEYLVSLATVVMARLYMCVCMCVCVGNEVL